jgi:hypothetical protein
MSSSGRAAFTLLKKLGAAAIEPTQVGSVWRKPAISAKNLAKLKKSKEYKDACEEILGGAGRASKSPETSHGRPLGRANKGHKHDRLRDQQVEKRQTLLESMDARIAEYREKKRGLNEKNTSALDRIVLTKKQLRLKSRNVQ